MILIKIMMMIIIIMITIIIIMITIIIIIMITIIIIIIMMMMIITILIIIMIIIIIIMIIILKVSGFLFHFTALHYILHKKSAKTFSVNYKFKRRNPDNSRTAANGLQHSGSPVVMAGFN